MLHAVFQDVLESLDAPREIALVGGPILHVRAEAHVGDVEGDGERFEALAHEFARVDSSANELDHAGVDAGEFEQGGHQVLNAGLQRLDEAQALDQIFGIAPRGKTVADELGGNGDRGEGRLELMGDVGECV